MLFDGKGVAGMKILAMMLVAAFVMTVGTSVAFAACAGHTQAQLVQTQPQEQLSQDQTPVTPITVAEKVTEAEKPAAKAPEKK